MVTTSVAAKSASISMATRSALLFVAGFIFCLKVTSAQNDGLGIPDMVALTGKVFSVSFASHPVYGNPAVNIQITASSKSASDSLPSWLIFNSTGRSLSGVPLLDDQGFILLTIKSQCVHIEKLDRRDNFGCHKSSDVFQLSISKFSWVNLSVLQFSSTGPSLMLSTESSYLDGVGVVDSTSGEHSCEGDKVVASLVLCASLEDISSEKRLEMLMRLSDFLSIPVASVTLEFSSSHSLKAIENGFQMVSAGPGIDDSCNLKQNVEMLWVLPCTTVKHLTDFIRVLQHNVDVGRIKEEIKAGVVGWYIASSNSLLTRQNRRRREASHRTIVPTPVVSAGRPTTIVGAYDYDNVETSSLTSPDLYSSSIAVLLTYRVHADRSSPIISSASSMPVSTIQPSSTMTEFLPEVQRTSQIIFTSLTSSSITQHFEEFSVLIPSITIIRPEQSLDHHELLSSSYIASSTLTPTSSAVSVFHMSQPEPSSIISFQLHQSKTEILTSSKHVPRIIDFQTFVGLSVQTDTGTFTTPLVHAHATAVALESEQSLSPSVLSPSSLLSSSSFSVLQFDSVLLVTSRIVEIVAFSVSSSEPRAVAEFSTYSSLPYSLSTAATISTWHFVHEPNSSVKILQTERLFDSQQIELTSSSPLIELSLLEQITTPISLTIYTTDTSLRVIESLPHVLSEDVTFILAPASDDIGYDKSSSAIDPRTDHVLTESTVTVAALEPAEGEIVAVTLDILSSETFFSFTVLEGTAEYVIASEYLPGTIGVTSSTGLIISPVVALSPISESDLSTSLVASATTWSTISFITSTTTAATETMQPTTAWRPTTSTVETYIQSSAFPSGNGSDEEIANNRPSVKKGIDLILVEQGRLLEFMIPYDVFVDMEDGNTSSLTLSLELSFNQKLPNNFWLYLESDKQILKGIPLNEDMTIKNFSILLVANDSSGLSEADSIDIQIRDLPRDSITHVFILKFDLDFQQFMGNRRNLNDILVKIGTYFGNNGTQYMTVLDVRHGSLVISWANNTLFGTVCRMDVIRSLLNRMLLRDGSVRSSFYRHVGRDNHLTEILFEPRGSCYVPSTRVTSTTTAYVVADTSRSHSLSIWAHVILPVMIAVLVFILIILIIIFCNRRRRQRQAVLNAEKEAVSNDRNPIIFPDEIEADDPSLKARDPLVLPTDPHVQNQNTTLDSSPSKSSHSHEKSRSLGDNGDQEWLSKEGQETGNDQDLKRKKDSKKQKDHGRMSGASATSTLSCDRPNNHYLEEEAGSRSSTLNSTKSLGPDKRHPKNPPPYWESQSDPPPYRMPPPYLTDTTTQV